MNPFVKLARSAVPGSLKSLLRSIHRDVMFRIAMRKYIQDPGSCANPGNPVLAQLIYGWGNESWSALDEYLAACIRHAIDSTGAILECGSGLSTVLISVIAKKRALSYWALENSPEWAERVRHSLSRYGLNDAVVLSAKPLRDYGEFSWYDPPLADMPLGFGLVICDGPPGTTKGGRYGLLPVMDQRIHPGCVILLDDAGREQEREIADRWKRERNAAIEVCGSLKPYIKLTVGVSPTG